MSDFEDDPIKDSSTSEERRIGRRTVFVSATAASVGAVAGMVIGNDPAGAANPDGEYVELGATNMTVASTEVTTTRGNGLIGQTSETRKSGVLGVDSSPGGGRAVQGRSNHGTGVYGSGYVDGVFGTSEYGDGVAGVTAADEHSGVLGMDNSAKGGNGILGNSTNGTGVYGLSTNGAAVAGYSVSSNGIFGSTSGDGYTGVSGYDSSPHGGYGVFCLSENGTALRADGNAFLNGDVTVTGALSKGGGAFKIDHPLDPENKFLYHSFVESPDMMNVYNGNVTLDSGGRASVELPDWFEALNRDFRYQLTAIGSPAPGLHISKKVSERSFAIAGGSAGDEVSWQVTGIRQDVWANANRIPLEVEKMPEDRGQYLHPELFRGEPIDEIAGARRHLAGREASRKPA